jgi:hypothetical protein
MTMVLSLSVRDKENKARAERRWAMVRTPKRRAAPNRQPMRTSVRTLRPLHRQ